MTSHGHFVCTAPSELVGAALLTAGGLGIATLHPHALQLRRLSAELPQPLPALSPPAYGDPATRMGQGPFFTIEYPVEYAIEQ